MKLLSVDASGKSAAAAVTEDGVLLADGFENNGFTHSETLLPLVDSVQKQAGVPIGEIDAFAVTTGPGSFTGLRIGCALVKGLAGDRSCFGVPTLKALAYGLRDEHGIVIPMMDARCCQVYTASFEVENGIVRQIVDDRAVAVDEVAEEIRSFLAAGKRVTVPGDGAYLLPADVAEKIAVVPPEKKLIHGASVAAAAVESEAVDAARLTLNYLRLSQAEREKNKKREEISK